MDRDAYWRLTESIIRIARGVAVGDRREVVDDIEALLDVDHELLQRALCNFGAAAYAVVADAIALDVSKELTLRVLLTPNYQQDLAVEAAEAYWGEAATQVWGCLTHDPKQTTPLGGTHFTIVGHAASVQAVVLNSALCVIVPLLRKCEVVQPPQREGSTSRPVDPRNPASRFGDGLSQTVEKLRLWLPERV